MSELVTDIELAKHLFGRNFNRLGEYLYRESLAQVIQAQDTIHGIDGPFRGSDVGIQPQQIYEVINNRDNAISSSLNRFFRYAQEHKDAINDRQSIFIQKTIPKLILFLSPNRRYEGDTDPQEEVALFGGLKYMFDQLSVDKPIHFISQLCPSYDYQIYHSSPPNMQKNGTLFPPSQKINHYTESILPTFGVYRSEKYMKTVEYIFSDLNQSGVDINFEFLSYTGDIRTGIDELVEMGQEIIQYYDQRGGREQLVSNLRNAAVELESICNERNGYQIANGNSGKVIFSVKSIEQTLSPQILQNYNDFLYSGGNEEVERLLKSGIDISSGAIRGNQINEWLNRTFDLDLQSLNYFIGMELNYRVKNHIPVDTDVIRASIMEAFTYFNIQSYTRYKDAIMFAGETTSDYTNGLLNIRHRNRPDIVVPSIMPRRFRPDNPTGIFGMREPFNRIVMTRDDASRLSEVINGGFSPEQLHDMNIIQLRD